MSKVRQYPTMLYPDFVLIAGKGLELTRSTLIAKTKLTSTLSVCC